MLLPSFSERSSPRHAARQGNLLPLVPPSPPLGGHRAAPSAQGGGRVLFHGGTAGVMCRSCLGHCCCRHSQQQKGTPATSGGSQRQAGMRTPGKPLLPGQGEETCCWHGSAPCSQGPNSPHTDQLVFLHFLLLYDKHLTHMKISRSPSLFRDICLSQCCRHRHISECVLFQINGPARQPGKTCHAAVTARQSPPCTLTPGTGNPLSLLWLQQIDVPLLCSMREEETERGRGQSHQTQFPALAACSGHDPRSACSGQG